MQRILFGFVALLAMVGCTTTRPNVLVYSSGFSFANYDYVVISKPDGRDTSTALYGMDVEFANLMSRYNMKVIGDKELGHLPPDDQKRSLFARMSLTTNNKRILLAVSFDDAVTDRTGASITTYVKGDLFNVNKRTNAFASASRTIIKALQKDKGLKITKEKQD